MLRSIMTILSLIVTTMSQTKSGSSCKVQKYNKIGAALETLTCQSLTLTRVQGRLVLIEALSEWINHFVAPMTTPQLTLTFRVSLCNRKGTQGNRQGLFRHTRRG